MKVFIFSKRFFIPFLIVFAGHFIYLTAEIYRVYQVDFNGKGVPSSVLWKWLWQSGGIFMGISFFAAFIVALSFYSHAKAKKDKNNFQPFSRINILLVMVMAIAGFFYISFCVPKNTLKAAQILSNVVFARSYDEFKKLMKDPVGNYKAERMMTLPELNRKKASAKNDENQHGISMFPEKYRVAIQKINWEIARKYAFPLTIILFYITGIFVGLSFYKIHSIVAILFSYFFIFIGWYYCQQVFEYWYKRGAFNVFIGAFGAVMLLTVLLVGWYFGLKRYGAFDKKQESFL